MRDLHAVIEQRQQVVGDDAFQRFAIVIAQPHPQSIELRPAEKRLAFRFELIRELADKKNRSHFAQRNLHVLAIGSQQVDGIVLPQADRIQIAAHGLFVGEHNDDFLVRGGWGSIFQNLAVPGPDDQNLPIDKMYVMLSSFSCQLIVFIRVRAPERRLLTEKKQILKSASIITLVTIVSRILGYVRDQRITLLLGTTLSADAYVLAYRIPNLFRRLVAEGSMTASFIPVFTGYMREKTKEEVWEFANRLFWTLALVAAVITILGMVFSPAVVHLFSGENVARGQAVDLNRIIFPYLFFISLAALAMGILNCFHVFGLPAATPVLLNVATILFSMGIVYRYFKDPATSLAV
jgi:hypothetical protein